MPAEDRARGLEPAGPDELLELFAKNVLETASDEELTEHSVTGRTGLTAKPFS
jgi:putative transposase